MLKRTILLAGAIAAFTAMAWDVEHDTIAGLAFEGLPSGVRATFRADEALDVIRFCHFPDWDETVEPSGFHTFAEIEAIVGRDEAAVLKATGCENSQWFHTDAGVAGTFAMLAKAFGEANGSRAAFYFSILTHMVADRASLNHTPLLHWRYDKFLNERFVTFKPQGPVTAKVRKLVRAHCPAALANDVFEAAAKGVERLYGLSARAAELEGVIAWGSPAASDAALVELLAEQIALMDDLGATAWTLRKKARALLPADMKQISARAHAAVATVDPAKQAVFRGLFDTSLDPKNPKATVGVVCEAFAGLGREALSFGGKAISAAAARTLRDNGYAVRAIDFRDVERTGFPDPKAVPVVLVALNDDTKNLSGAALGAFGKYREADGKLFVLGGRDPGGITAMRPQLRLLDEKICWETSGVVCHESFKRLGAKPVPFRRDFMAGAACAPSCPFELKADHTIYPLVWLYDNRPGRGQRVVGGRTVRVMWLPEYLFTFGALTDVTPANWTDLRLDSAGSAILLDAMEDFLFGAPLATRPAKRTDGWWSSGVPEQHLQAIRDNVSKEFDLVMVGDSITHRWLQKGKGGEETWPALTNTYHSLNLGIGADRTQHVLWRLAHGELDGYKAKVFTLLIGVNNTGTDPAEDIALGTKKIVELIRAKHPESKILLFPIFPHGKTKAERAKSEQVNRLTASLADGANVICLDIGDRFLGQDGLLLQKVMYVDNLHPIEGGYRIWYEALVPKLRELICK